MGSADAQLISTLDGLDGDWTEMGPARIRALLQTSGFVVSEKRAKALKAQVVRSCVEPEVPSDAPARTEGSSTEPRHGPYRRPSSCFPVEYVLRNARVEDTPNSRLAVEIMDRHFDEVEAMMNLQRICSEARKPGFGGSGIRALPQQLVHHIQACMHSMHSIGCHWVVPCLDRAASQPGLRSVHTFSFFFFVAGPMRTARSA